MARSAKADVNMQERLNEFDPGGALPAACSAIFALFDDKGDAITRAFYDSYLSHTQLDRKLAPQALEALQAEILRYQRLKYNEIRSEEWADSARACVTHARRHNISVRTVLVAMAAANEVALDAIWSAPDVDPVQRRALAQAMLRLSMIEAELISMALGEALAREEAIEREHSGQLFEQRIVGEIDSASRLGEGLREQAKDASAATRGMLGKASEVAAAAEQSALAMREAAHTSAGLIRAIEDARAEVEGTADVAARASVQAGEAVTMSSTLSDHAKSIESILGLIRDIAGQTNLLALNATIEAARAGDAGRGFAVVAQEVKSLANQTARATDDIANKIMAIQASTRQSVETNQRIRDIVDEVRTSADRIRTAMDAQAQTVTMITAAVDETALAADSMSSTISAIRQDTEVVASEIDELERGFMSVEGKLASLRTASADLSRRVA
jgi:methyl-accepting chemotaxis protein